MSDIAPSPVDRGPVDDPGRSGPGALAGARRIVVLRLDNAGDVILAGPTIRTLRAALPAAELVLAASPIGASSAGLLPWLDDVLVWQALWQDASGAMTFDPAREVDAIDRLRTVAADAAIILTSFSQSAAAAGYACYVAGIPIRVGHEELFCGGVLSHAIPGPAPAHQAERNLHVLRGLGIEPASEHLEVRLPGHARATIDRWLREADIDDGDPIVLAPGASCTARRYDATGFGLAAAELRSQTGRPVVLIGNADERPITDTVLRSVPGALDLVGRTSIVEAAAVVASAGLVLTNNSLAMHLAEALGRPVVVPYAGTDREAEWAPRRTASRLLRRPTSCAPCRLFDCPFEGHPCLDIAPARIVAAGLALIGSGHADRAAGEIQVSLPRPRAARSSRPMGG